MAVEFAKVVELALESSSQRLEAQTNSALAADARAVGFAGLVFAAAAILCGLAPNAASPTFVLIGSGILVVAGLVAGTSAKPVDFYMRGAPFSVFSNDIAANKPYEEVLHELGVWNDQHAIENGKALDKNASLIRRAFLLAIAGFVVALVPQLAIGVFGFFANA